jgi:hypothetical protein
MTETKADSRWYRADVAAYLGVRVDSLQRAGLPDPDGTTIDRQYVRPWWYRSTIQAWVASRPGTGTPGRPRPHYKPDADELVARAGAGYQHMSAGQRRAWRRRYLAGRRVNA